MIVGQHRRSFVLRSRRSNIFERNTTQAVSSALVRTVQHFSGVKLCSNATLDTSNGILDPENRFWRVTSNARQNGTQTVDAFVFESSYDRQSGETRIEERQYDDSYATLFKRALEHKGMLLIVSPRDGQVEATVGICRRKK